MTDEKVGNRPYVLQCVLQGISILVMVVGGLWVYGKVTRHITQSTLDLQAALIENAKLEAEQKKLEVEQTKTPKLNVSVCATPQSLVSLGVTKPGVSHITLDVRLENLGFAPIDLGDMEMKVYYAYADGQLKEVLQHIEKSMDDIRTGTASTELAPYAFTKGELFAINADDTEDLTWISILSLARKESLD